MGIGIRSFSAAVSGCRKHPGSHVADACIQGEMTLFLGKREVKLMQLGAGHTSGDIVAWVPDRARDVFGRSHRVPFGLLLRGRALASLARYLECNSRFRSEVGRSRTRRRLERARTPCARRSR